MVTLFIELPIFLCCTCSATPWPIGALSLFPHHPSSPWLLDICSASGFTTRSDVGPARKGPSEERSTPDQFQDPDNEYGLFAGTVYEADKEEADRIYESVNEAMDQRRKARRETREREEMDRFERNGRRFSNSSRI
jgi:hypothetical protein